MGEFSELGRKALSAAIRFRAGSKDRPQPITQRPQTYEARVIVEEDTGRREWRVFSHGVEAHVLPFDHTTSIELSRFPIPTHAPIALIDFTPGNKPGSELPNPAENTARLLELMRGFEDLLYLWDSKDADRQGMPTPAYLVANPTNPVMSDFAVRRLGFSQPEGLTSPFASYSRAHLQYEQLAHDPSRITRLAERAGRNTPVPAVSGGSGLEE